MGLHVKIGAFFQKLYLQNIEIIFTNVKIKINTPLGKANNF